MVIGKGAQLTEIGMALGLGTALALLYVARSLPGKRLCQI